MKAWIIAEQLCNAEFRIVTILDSPSEPLDNFRVEVVNIFQSYEGRKIPNSRACLFSVFKEKDSELLLSTAPDKQSNVFILLKNSGKTALEDIVNIQRSAWCHSQGADVLKYSLQNGGGGKTTVFKLNSNKSFRRFVSKNCIPKSQTFNTDKL